MNKLAITYRQKEVLLLMSKGLTDVQIADDLGITRNTVRKHVRAIMDYFEVTSRTHAVAQALRLGVID